MVIPNKQRVLKNAARFYAARIEKGLTLTKGSEKCEMPESRRQALEASISDAINLEQRVEEALQRIEAYRSESFG